MRLCSELHFLLRTTANFLPSPCQAASPAVSDPTLSDEQLEIALTQRSLATKNLLKRLSELHPSEHGDDKVDELTAKCRTLLSDVSYPSSFQLEIALTSISILSHSHSNLEKRFDFCVRNTIRL